VATFLVLAAVLASFLGGNRIYCRPGATGGAAAIGAGLALLGFTSVYRERFEVVIFLQNLRELYQRLAYRRLLIITGVMLLFVLLVSVGEEANEMQLAGWIGTTQVPGLSVPGWIGTVHAGVRRTPSHSHGCHIRTVTRVK
jgi:high-affinity Fe2+/Pb2+ permease